MPTSRTEDQIYVNSSVDQITNAFRVENRRARPKIVQNVNDQGNAFFSKQANIINTSQKR